MSAIRYNGKNVKKTPLPTLDPAAEPSWAAERREPAPPPEPEK
jgi:hypothetical protein